MSNVNGIGAQRRRVRRCVAGACGVALLAGLAASGGAVWAAGGGNGVAVPVWHGAVQRGGVAPNDQRLLCPKIAEMAAAVQELRRDEGWPVERVFRAVNFTKEMNSEVVHWVYRRLPAYAEELETRERAITRCTSGHSFGPQGDEGSEWKEGW